MNKEAYFALLGEDIRRFDKGVVSGGSIYEEVREKSRRSDSEVEVKKERRILNLLRRRAPLLALSFSLSLVGCTREAPASYQESPPVITPGEELPICPPVPEGCQVDNEEPYIFRFENLDKYLAGTRICYYGPSLGDPTTFFVDIWTKGNQNKTANCYLICNRVLDQGEIDQICDVPIDLSPELVPTPDSDWLQRVSFTNGGNLDAREIMIPPELSAKADSLRNEINRIKEATPERRETKAVMVFLQDLKEKVIDITSRRRTWLGGDAYWVNPGDTLWLIGQKIGRTPEDIYQRNKWQIEDPNLIFPNQKLYLPEVAYPSATLRELFLKVESDFQELERLREIYGPRSFLAERKAAEIWNFWQNAPKEGETVEKPVIKIDAATGEKGQWIAGVIERFLEEVPDSGRILSEINIIPRSSVPDFPYRMWVYTYKEKGSSIYIADPPPDTFNEGVEWDSESLLVVFSHELLGHSMSLYSEGYNLGWLKPVQVIDLVEEQTILWDRYYRPTGEGKASFGLSEEERNAEYVDTFFEDGRSEAFFFQYSDPEEVKPFEEHYNRLISATLGYSLTLDDLAEKLNVRHS